MVALIHDEGVLGDGFRINFIGIEEVDEFGFCCRSLLGGHEADFIRSGARGDLGENNELKSQGSNCKPTLCKTEKPFHSGVTSLALFASTNLARAL